MLRSITLEVVGSQQLVCEGCEQRVERALNAQPGVQKVRADARNQRIEVLFDDAKLDPAALADNCGKVGYQAKIVGLAFTGHDSSKVGRTEAQHDR